MGLARMPTKIIRGGPR